jgi:hypothetical protein
MPEDSDFNTIGLHNDIRNDLYEIVKYLHSLYPDKKKKRHVSYNDAVSYLLREYKKMVFLKERVEKLQGEFNRKLGVIQKYLKELSLSNGQKIELDINKIPELNRFVEDKDVEIIRKVKNER